MYSNVPWSLCVCLSDTAASCAKVAVPITVVFTVWTHVGARNGALGGGLDLPGEGAVLGTFFWPIVLEVTFLYFRH